MRKFFALTFLLLASTISQSRIIDIPAVKDKLKPRTQNLISGYEPGALRDDYQAMRNIAFTWSTDATREQPEAAIIGCAWYAQIINLHKSKTHAGDESNRELYCSRLSSNALQEAANLSNHLGKSIKIPGNRSIK